MPTNDFQELVRAIEQVLASKTAKIESPAFVQAQGLPDYREVDILLDDVCGPYRIRVAIEATKMGRKLGIGKYDSLCKKYTGEGKVAVDKFVIVTEKGFTRDVIRKAEREDVELITVAETIGGKRSEVFAARPAFFCTVICVPEVKDTTSKQIIDNGEIICEGETTHVRCVLRNFVTNEVPKQAPNFFKELLEAAAKSPNGIAHYKFSLAVKGSAKLKVFDQEYAITSMDFLLHQQVRKGANSTTCIDRVSTKQGTTKIVQASVATGHGPIQATFSFGADGKSPGEKATVTFPPGFMEELLKKEATRQMLLRTKKGPNNDGGRGANEKQAPEAT